MFSQVMPMLDESNSRRKECSHESIILLLSFAQAPAISRIPRSRWRDSQRQFGEPHLVHPRFHRRWYFLCCFRLECDPLQEVDFLGRATLLGQDAATNLGRKLVRM